MSGTSFTAGSRSKAAQAATSGYYEYPAGKSSEDLWRSRGLRDGVVELTGQTSVTEFLYLLRFMAPWSTLVRREEFMRLNGFHERTRSLYGEDTCLWMKLLTNAPVVIDLKPRVKFHRESSSLSGNTSGARPVEPFLVDPEEVLSVCPDSLEPLLKDAIQARALKTACVLGFWGHWKEAGTIRRRFWDAGALRHRHSIPAVLAGTRLAPLGGTFGVGPSVFPVRGRPSLPLRTTPRSPRTRPGEAASHLPKPWHTRTPSSRLQS